MKELEKYDSFEELKNAKPLDVENEEEMVKKLISKTTKKELKEFYKLFKLNKGD